MRSSTVTICRVRDGLPPVSEEAFALPLRADDKQVLKYLATYLVYGLAAGLTFGLGVLATDLGNLRTMAMESGRPILVLAVFFFSLLITFGSVGMGVGVMTFGMGDDE